MSKTKQTRGRRGGGRHRPLVRSRRHGVLASLWAIFTAVFTIAWLTLGGVLWCVAALIGGVATVLTTFATFDPDTAVPAEEPRRPQPAKPRPHGRARPRAGSPGTGLRKPAGPVSKKPACQASCRTSTKPANSCDCVCGGKSHGVQKRRLVTNA